MKITLQSVQEKLLHYVQQAKKNAVVAFLLFLVGVYGFLGWRITQLLAQEPDQTAVSAELKTVGIPKVDEDVVHKMERLNDNSVSVQTLFDEARSNPFQE